MPGIGVIVNVATVVAGSIVGLAFGNVIHERFRSIALKAIGLATFVLGTQMAIGTRNALILVVSLLVGGLLGEAIGIERGLEGFGRWLQQAVYRVPWLAPSPSEDPGRKEHTLVEGFVTASLLFCVGAMTILGSLKDGLGDPGLLYVKATLDGVAAVALASTLGIGVVFSIIPILVIQGGIALGAGALQPLLTAGVIRELSAAGGVLILAIGLDLMEIKRLPVGNLLLAILIAAVLGGIWG